jgi:hypothetical protein
MLDRQPPQRRSLPQPQRTRQIRERAVSRVEGKHFLVQPKRPRYATDVDQDSCTN